MPGFPVLHSLLEFAQIHVRSCLLVLGHLILCLKKIITADSNINFFFCYRVDEKTKKYCIPFVKPNKHSPPGAYNINVTTLVSELFSVVEEQTLVISRLY